MMNLFNNSYNNNLNNNNNNHLDYQHLLLSAIGSGRNLLDTFNNNDLKTELKKVNEDEN